jgi:putative FmdB family regulatory protein
VPIYEYKCDQCDHQFEILQKISDDPAKTCPDCGKDGLRKLISAAAFKLKGTGWYETDFKDKKPKKDAKTSTGTKTKSKSDSASKKPDSAGKKDSGSSTSSASPK